MRSTLDERRSANIIRTVTDDDEEKLDNLLWISLNEDLYEKEVAGRANMDAFPGVVGALSRSKRTETAAKIKPYAFSLSPIMRTVLQWIEPQPHQRREVLIFNNLIDNLELRVRHKNITAKTIWQLVERIIQICNQQPEIVQDWS